MAENTNIYYGSGIGVAGNIDIGAIGLPADSRVMVKTSAGLAELQAAKRVYDGMLVYVEDTHTYHKCRVDWDANKDITSCTWTEVVIKSEEELRAIITATTTAAMEFKGATATLPATAIKGDMYKVSGTFTVGAEADAEGAGFTTEIGDSIVFNGEKWYLIPSGDDIENTWRIIKVEGESLGTESDGKDLNLAAGAMLDVTLAENGTVTYKHEAIVSPDDKGAKWVDVTADGRGDAGTYKIVLSEDYINSDRHNATLNFEGGLDWPADNVDVYEEIGVFGSSATCAFSNVLGTADRETIYTVSNDIVYGETSEDYQTYSLVWNPEYITVYKQETARTYITGVETDGFGHITGYTTATETVVDTNTTYEFEGQSDEATSVYLHVKASDADQDEVIYFDAYSKNEVDLKIDDVNERLTDLEEAPAASISSDDIANWNAEVGAKELAQGVKDAVDTNKATWDKAGTALQAADLETFKTNEVAPKLDTAIYEAYIADKKLSDTEIKAYVDEIGGLVESNAHTEIETAKGEFYTGIENITKEDGLIASAKQEAIDAAKEYADSLNHKDTTYTVAPTTNALEFTVTPSEGEAQTVKLVAPTVDVGVTKVTAGTDIAVSPEAGTGNVTIAHKGYSTGRVEDVNHNSLADPSFLTGIDIENGHVVKGYVQNLKQVLEAMEFIFDGGEFTDEAAE